jgi:hypothetical protein
MQAELPWSGDWEEWRAILDRLRWESQPAGFQKARLSDDINSLMPLLRGLPGRSNPHTSTFSDLAAYRFRIDPRNSAFVINWYDGCTFIDRLGGRMSTLLHLRFHRLAIAAELHRHETGSYPDRIEHLTIKPLISPFDGEPIQVKMLPDGRMRFEAVGASLLPDGTLHFDPTTPITFEYPPKP